MSVVLERRVHAIEKWLEKTAYAQFQYQMKLDTFHDEMADFKDEMADFKDEMSVYKDEARREIREMNRKWGELANKMGTIVEDIVLPNLPGILREHFGVEETVMVAPRIRRRHPLDRSRTREFDTVIVTDDTVFLNETKSSMRMSHIEHFAGNYHEVTEYFPEYADYTVIPIMSSLYIPPEMVAALTERGIFAMGMGEDNMELLNATELGRPGVS
jgi:hypothetical protein